MRKHARHRPNDDRIILFGMNIRPHVNAFKRFYHFLGKHFLVTLAILIILVRLQTLSAGGFIDADSHYHKSVVQQSFESGRLSNHNALDVCYEGMATHPIGFYALPFVLSSILPVDQALGASQVIFAVVMITLLYFLAKKLFGKEVATIYSLILAVSYAALSKTNPVFYRGDQLIIPFLAISLLFAYKSMEQTGLKRKILYALPTPRQA